MKINGSTKLYGIIGNPVSHSLSPAMHNAAFGKLELNKVYIPFPVTDVKHALQGFKALGVRGASVTIPHKEAVIPHLDSLDPVAEKIGAVNTLVINDGKIQGLNTDWIGSNRALEQLTDLKNKNVLILGAGGSAKAIGFGLLEAGATIAIASRTPSKGKELASLLDCPWHPIAETASQTADILVNATSVGMKPYDDQTPMAKEGLSNFKIVMDIVYSPQKTKLLAEAEEAGCKIINGLAMLLFQGAAQFELWTKMDAPVELMQQELMKGLAQKK